MLINDAVSHCKCDLSMWASKWMQVVNIHISRTSICVPTGFSYAQLLQPPLYPLGFPLELETFFYFSLNIYRYMRNSLWKVWYSLRNQAQYLVKDRWGTLALNLRIWQVRCNWELAMFGDSQVKNEVRPVGHCFSKYWSKTYSVSSWFKRCLERESCCLPWSMYVT